MNSIYISDQGELLLIDAPEKPKYGCVDDGKGICHHCVVDKEAYEAAIASAIAKGVKFKPIQQMFDLLWEHIFKFSDTDNIKELVGQIFPLPTGYKVSFEKKIFTDGGWQYVQYDIDFDNHQGLKRKLAILSKLEEEKVAPVYTGGLEGINVNKADMISNRFPTHQNFTGPSEEPVVTFKDCVFESVAPSEEVKLGGGQQIPTIQREMFTYRELEIAFCIGMLNQKDLDINKLSDQLNHTKIDLVIDYIKSLRVKVGGVFADYFKEK